MKGALTVSKAEMLVGSRKSGDHGPLSIYCN